MKDKTEHGAKNPGDTLILIDDKDYQTGSNPRPLWTHVRFDQSYNRHLKVPRLMKWSEWPSLKALIVQTSAEQTPWTALAPAQRAEMEKMYAAGVSQLSGSIEELTKIVDGSASWSPAARSYVIELHVRKMAANLFDQQMISEHAKVTHLAALLQLGAERCGINHHPIEKQLAFCKPNEDVVLPYSQK